jgi:hypothetical protein
MFDEMITNIIVNTFFKIKERLDDPDGDIIDSIDTSRLDPIRIVKVGYLDIPIYTADIEDFGYFTYHPNPHIVVDAKTDGWNFVVTLRHELNHAAEWIYGHSNTFLDEERRVDFSAAITATISRDNPGFDEWLDNIGRHEV